MLLTSQQFIGLSVVSEDGQELGRIKSLEINGDNLQITKLVLASSNLAKKIVGRDLVIDVSQVVEVTTKEVVVKSSMIKSSAIAEAV